MKIKLILSILLFQCAFFKLFAQSDTLAELRYNNVLSMQFPYPHTNQKADMREVLEGRNNGIIYNLFISDEFSIVKIQNTLQLDSLYAAIVANTLGVYSGDVIESNTYYEKFGELRAKYLYVKSTSKENPYIAEYYIVCVTGRMYIMSTTYLSNYTEAQIKQAKEFRNTIHFNEKLGWNDQMNRF